MNKVNYISSDPAHSVCNVRHTEFAYSDGMSIVRYVLGGSVSSLASLANKH